MRFKYKYGADPEFFIARKSGKEFYCVPPLTIRRNGFNLHEMDEKHPKFVIISGIGGDIIIHEDGAAFELSVPASKSMVDVWKNCLAGQKKIAEIAEQYGYVFKPIPTIAFDTKEFVNDPEAIYCTRFGCDKDYDAWNIEVEQIEEDASEHAFRYGGGHIHTSIVKSDILFNSPVPAIKAMSFTLGNFISSVSPYPQEDYLRTFRYGKPGRFRPQKYPDGSTGIEYRTPSNAWTSITDENIIREMEFWIQVGIENLLANPKVLMQLTDDIKETTFEAILRCDSYQAKDNLQYIKDTLKL